MTNPIVLEKMSAGLKAADTGRTVTAYEHNALDVAGSPPNGAIIGACTEMGVTGVYTIDLTGDSYKATIVSDGNCVAGLIGVMLHSDADVSEAS